MRKFLRRIRGVIGIGLAWGAAWSLAGLIPRWLFDTDAPLPLIFAVLGFAAGVMFSLLLVLAERRRSFDQMSLPRFAAWGAAGGILLSALFSRAASLSGGDVLTIVPVFAVASAMCASGSLALARRAERRELLEPGGVTAYAELTGRESAGDDQFSRGEH